MDVNDPKSENAGWNAFFFARKLFPPGIRGYASYAALVLPQKAVTQAAMGLGVKLAAEPAWPKRSGQVKRVLMVAPKYTNGHKELGLNYEYYHLFGALKDVAEECEFFDSFSTEKEATREEINESMLKEVDRYRPDLVVFAPCRFELDRKVARKISEESGAATMAFFFDDAFRFDRFSRDWGASVHVIASQDDDALKKWSRLGHIHHYKVPFGYNEKIFRPGAGKMQHDVSFVGVSSHPGRRQAVEFLEGKGINVDCFGSGWPKSRFVSLEEMVEIFQTSRINLNFSTAAAAWARPQVKGRVFEVTGCGGFLLTEYVKGLEDVFEIGKEIDVFRNKDELAEKVEYYLKHEEERARMAKAGLARAQKEHTYQKRFLWLFEKINEETKRLSKQPGD
jgi:spore maturation protein CgeB